MLELNSKILDLIEKIIESQFDDFLINFLGIIPKFDNKKKLILTSKKDSLTSLFIDALGQKQPNKNEEEVLKTQLRVAAGYVDALKIRTQTRAMQAVNAHSQEQKLKKESIKPSTIRKLVLKEMDSAQNHVKLIANSESNKCINTGTALQIVRVAEDNDDENPVVFFNVTIDDVTGDEEFRLHLLPDRKTPRLWYLNSEVSADYHKKGDNNVNLPGLHPNCRCFFNSNYTVITEKEGSKKIKDVVIGDRVLTHTGKFKKVIGTFGQKGLPSNGSTGVEIKFKTPNGKIKGLMMTDDHMMLTNNGWKRADEITTLDTFKYLFKECEMCKTPFMWNTQKPDTRFCSNKCKGDSRIGSIGWAKGTTRDPELVTKNAKLISNSKHLKAIESGRRTVVKSFCNGCKIEFEYEQYYIDTNGRGVYRNLLQYCSSSCKSKTTASKQWQDPIHRQNITEKNSISMNKQYADGTRKPENIKIAREALYKTGRGPTKDQKKIYEIVKEIYPDAELEFPIGKYFADISIPSIRVVIEWDGGGHWLSVYKGLKTLEKKQKEDDDRDLYMNQNNWHVLRFNDKTGYKNVLEDVRRVSLNSTNGYSFQDVEIVSIKKLDSYHTKKNARLYDITVEEDHSFVVCGVVSHNCKITYLPKGFGFDESGKIAWKKLDHDEIIEQRKIFPKPE